MPNRIVIATNEIAKSLIKKGELLIETPLSLGNINKYIEAKQRNCNLYNTYVKEINNFDDQEVYIISKEIIQFIKNELKDLIWMNENNYNVDYIYWKWVPYFVRSYSYWYKIINVLNKNSNKVIISHSLDKSKNIQVVSHVTYSLAAATEYYNLQIVSRVSNYLGISSIAKVEPAMPKMNKIQKRRASIYTKIVNLIKRELKNINDYIPRFNIIKGLHFYDEYLDNKEIKKIIKDIEMDNYVSYRHITFKPDELNLKYVNSNYKNNKFIEYNKRDLINLLKSIVIKEIPLDHFQISYLKRISIFFYYHISRPVALISSVSSTTSSLFSFYESYTKRKGTKIIHTQHGLSYSLDKINESKEIEIQTSDIFISWDGYYKKNKNTISLYPKYLNRKKIKSITEEHSILIILDIHDKFFRAFHPWQFFDYMHDVNNLLYALKEKRLFGKTKVRLYGSDYGWGLKEWLIAEHRDILFSDSTKKLTRIIDSNTHIICTYTSTSIMEAINFTNKIYFYTKSNKLIDACKKNFESEDIKNKFYFEDPTILANYINNNIKYEYEAINNEKSIKQSIETILSITES